MLHAKWAELSSFSPACTVSSARPPTMGSVPTGGQYLEGMNTREKEMHPSGSQTRPAPPPDAGRNTTRHRCGASHASRASSPTSSTPPRRAAPRGMLVRGAETYNPTGTGTAQLPLTTFPQFRQAKLCLWRAGKSSLSVSYLSPARVRPRTRHGIPNGKPFIF